jgi:hypothetical protein
MSDNEKHVWQDAHVGAGTPQLGLRVTEEERERLEQLRQELRLTSKGQVMRVALDILERFMVAGSALGFGSLRGEDWREVAAFAQKGVQNWEIQNLEKNALAESGSGAGARGSSADAAPSGPVDDKQLELPEMPGQVVNNAA